MGAPQRHGQNLYKLNVATLDPDFARGLDDYDPAAFDKFEMEGGRKWSPNYGTVSSSYTGQQFNSTGPSNGFGLSRFDNGFLNERENYFSKPQFNVNWYSYLGDGLNLSTVAYYSGGTGRRNRDLRFAGLGLHVHAALPGLGRHDCPERFGARRGLPRHPAELREQPGHLRLHLEAAEGLPG